MEIKRRVDGVGRPKFDFHTGWMFLRDGIWPERTGGYFEAMSRFFPALMEASDSMSVALGLEKVGICARIFPGGEPPRVFKGATINTPSLLVIEDALDALRWVEALGGQSGTIARVNESFAHFQAWLKDTPYFTALASDPATMSQTALCISISDDWFLANDPDIRSAIVKQMQALLEAETVAVDIGAYRDAPTGLRIWGGPTVDPEDMARLLPWLDWAWDEARHEHGR